MLIIRFNEILDGCCRTRKIGIEEEELARIIDAIDKIRADRAKDLKTYVVCDFLDCGAPATTKFYDVGLKRERLFCEKHFNFYSNRRQDT
jgi:hypothetical protein